MTLIKPTMAPKMTEPLPPPIPRWPRTLYWLGAGAIGGGTALVAGYDTAAPAVATAGAIGAGNSAVRAIRTYRRREVLDPLTQALAPLQGWRKPDRATVRATAWKGGFWSVTPQRLVINYSAGIDDTDTEWVASLIEKVSSRLGLNFCLHIQDQRRCRLILVEEESSSQRTSRTERLVKETFGKGAEVVVELNDDGEAKKVKVKLSDPLVVRLSRAQARYSVINTISALLPGRWSISWDLENAKVNLEQKAPMPTEVPHIPFPITKETLYLIQLGIDEDLEPVTWNLKGTGPHLLVVGKTGTGKTVGILGAVMEVARRGWRVWIADPKRVEFMGLRTWPNVQIVATAVEEMIVVIKEAHDLMETRYEQIEKGSADEASFEPLVLVLDEFRNFHRQVTAWYNQIKVKGMPAKCEVFEWVAALAEKARTAQIHLVMGTQRPDAEFLTGSMRDNFDSRLALGRLSRAGAMMMWESIHLGTTVPRKIRGRGTAINDNEEVKEVQVLWTPDPRRAYALNKVADIKILEALRPDVITHHPLLVSLGDEGCTDIDGQLLDPWSRVMDAQLVPAQEAIALPSLTLTKGPQTTDGEQIDEEDAVVDLFEGYLPEEASTCAGLEIGDLICVDEHFDVWAVIEALDEDPDDPDYMCIAWRDDDGQSGQLSQPADEPVQVRHPGEEPDDE